ncbi:MAG: serine hydrolase [Planctomycetes bacterium]|nr:serine hydrolase [Planctomycetota bacterium]
MKVHLFGLAAPTLVAATLFAQSEPDLEGTVDRFCRPLAGAEVVVGFVAGVVHGERELVRPYGRLSWGAPNPPAADSLYEIGSLSKLFTGLLLADAVERGLVALDDPVQRHLPDGVTLQPWRGEHILLRHLSTHTSGLPRLARDEPENPEDPYAHYDIEAMHAAIADARARRRPGTVYEYSNLGAGILGYVLMRVNGCSSYDELLQQRLAEPLGLRDTAVELGAELQTRLAPPHDANGDPGHEWHLAMMAGAGGIRSTVPDLLKFARLQLAPAASPLAAAVRLTQQRHFEGKGQVLGLGWHFARDGSTLVHSGQTGGYHAQILVVPAEQTAVCMLTNTASGAIDLVAERLLQSLLGMDVAPPEFERPVEVARDRLEPLVGTYRLVAGMEFEVTLRDRGLYAQLTGQPAWRLYARSPTEFFYRIVEASIAFELDGDEVERLVLHQNGRDMPYRRIE